MRVLHVVQTPLDYVGGPATYVRELAKHLARRGITIGVVAPQIKQKRVVDELINTHGVFFYPINARSPFEFVLRDPWVFGLKSYEILSKMIGEYDIVNVHVESLFLYRHLVDMSKKLAIVTTVHGFPLYVDYESLKSKLNLYKLLHFVLVAPRHYFLLINLIKNSKAIVTLTHHLKRIVTNISRDVNDDRVFVIPNAVDINLFRPIRSEVSLTAVKLVVRKKCGKALHGDKDIILYVGRIEPHKGIDTLLKALARVKLKSWFLVLVGEGLPDYLNYLNHIASKYSITENLCFVGKVPHHLLPYFYSAAYVYVLPSLLEGFPATILEAMACGTPVIATKVGGVSEAIVNHVNGILIDPGSIDQLCDALEYILSDSNYRNKLSSAAREIIKNKFSWNNIAEQYRNLYMTLL